MISPLMWGAMLVASEVSLAAMAVVSARNLRHRGGRNLAYVVLGIVALLGALAPPCAAWVSPWASIALLIPIAMAYIRPAGVVSITGGPLPRWGLAQDAREISARWDAIGNGQDQERDAIWLLEHSRRLDRWRSPQTAELIDLYQEKVQDLLYHQDREGFKKRAAARNARIEELLSSYWADGRVTPSRGECGPGRQRQQSGHPKHRPSAIRPE
jgi:hypothetical protein